MLACMNIEHEIHECAFELRTHSPIDGKSRAGDFRRAFHIEDLQFGAQIPMRLRWKSEIPRLAPAADLDVVLRAAAHWNRFMRDVGDPGQQRPERFIQRLYLFVQRRDSVADRPNLLLLLRGIDALLTKRIDLIACRVALRLELLGFGYSGAPLRVELAELANVQLEAARCQALRNRI